MEQNYENKSRHKNNLYQLRELAIEHSRKLHPDLPEYARSVRNYTDRNANGLTRCIVDFLNFSGHQAERINCTGRPIDETKVVVDVLGDLRHIGSMKWMPTSGQKGTADIAATIKNKSGIGVSVKLEIKMHDRQSPAQKQYQAQIEKAGGVYVICRSFNDFLEFYNNF